MSFVASDVTWLRPNLSRCRTRPALHLSRPANRGTRVAFRGPVIGLISRLRARRRPQPRDAVGDEVGADGQDGDREDRQKHAPRCADQASGSPGSSAPCPPPAGARRDRGSPTPRTCRLTESAAGRTRRSATRRCSADLVAQDAPRRGARSPRVADEVGVPDLHGRRAGDPRGVRHQQHGQPQSGRHRQRIRPCFDVCPRGPFFGGFAASVARIG
jgi:hypothetical protein